MPRAIINGSKDALTSIFDSVSARRGRNVFVLLEQCKSKLQSFQPTYNSLEIVRSQNIKIHKLMQVLNGKTLKLRGRMVVVIQSSQNFSQNRIAVGLSFVGIWCFHLGSRDECKVSPVNLSFFSLSLSRKLPHSHHQIQKKKNGNKEPHPHLPPNDAKPPPSPNPQTPQSHSASA